MPQITQAYEWQGRTVLGSDGEKIGRLKEIYEDKYTGKPDWATVSGGLFGTKSRFVPLAGAAAEGDRLRVAVTKHQVTDAPVLGVDDELSELEEERLFEHYGVPYTTEGSTTARGAPQSAGARSDRIEGDAGGRRAQGDSRRGRGEGDAMTRSEEELRVGVGQRVRGRARLRKYVVTEEVQRTVPVRHEEVRVEREPVTDENVGEAMSGAELSEAEHEVVLHEEQPVVEKRTVPKERVRLEKDTVTGEQEVSEQVRKERIEAQGDTPR